MHIAPGKTYYMEFLKDRFWGLYYLPFNDQCPSHIETSQLICIANQLTGFYVRGTLIVKELIQIYAEYRISSHNESRGD